MTRENHEKTMRLAGQLIAAGSVLKAAKADVLLSDTRTRDLLDVASAAVEKAMFAAWEKAGAEPIEP